MITLDNCRLCQNRCGSVKLVNNSFFINQVYECTDIKIDPEEDASKWPRLVCDQCHALVELFHQFRLHSKMVDDNLHRILTQNDSPSLKDSPKLKQEEVVKEVIFLQFDGEENGMTENIPLEFLESNQETEDCEELEDVTQLFKCPICHIMYFKLDGLEAHKRSHTELCCFSCEKVFDSISSREQHVCGAEDEVNLGSTSLKPNVKVFPVIIKEEVSYNDGISSDASDKPETVDYKFDMDEFESGDKDIGFMLEQDQADEPAEEELLQNTPQRNNIKVAGSRVCSQCNEKFVNRQDLMKHMKTHAGSFVCKYEGCGKICKSEYSLKYHHWKHNGSNSNVLCKVCGKSFLFASYLKYHEKTHTGVKDFKCTHCDKAFYKKTQLDLHVKTHHEGVRYYCSICPKSFLTSINLQRHEIVHSGIKRFTCEECSRQFYTEKELIRHRKRNHQGERRHICEYCTKAFFEKTQYRIHVRSHTGERPFVCENEGCGKAYYERAHLKSHQKTCNKRHSRREGEKEEQQREELEREEQLMLLLHVNRDDIVDGEYLLT